MTEETSLPLARMITINKPSFWIFMCACITLYIYNKYVTPDTGDRIPYLLKGFFVLGAAFVGLFLNLVGDAIKNTKFKKVFGIICYVFEAVSIVLLSLMIIVK
jgi:hypothetical protein